jgi:hypothetical protein
VVDLTLYEAIEGEPFPGWLCRRCVLVRMEGVMDDDGEVTGRGVTLAALVESATKHEEQVHGQLGEDAASSD